MEQITYYQGENIAICAKAYEDNTCTTTQDISDYTVEVLLYTDEQKLILKGSSARELDFEIDFLDDSQISINLAPELTSQLEPGFLRMEMAIKDTDDDVVQIAKCSLARIEESLISKIMGDDN
ncbi:MAG: hypothetical protein R3Y15_00960 [Rikenellaceae bacterium]